MRLFRIVGKGINEIGGGLLKGGVHVTSSIVATRFPRTGEYIKEVGGSVVHSSQTVIENTSHFADGAVNGIYGAVTKDTIRIEDGWNDVKTSSLNTVKGIGGGLVYTGRSIGQTVQGALNQDGEQMTEGLKNIGKVGAVGMLGVGIFDMLADSDSVQAAEIETRNNHLDGSSHSVTDVPFEKNTIEHSNAQEYTGIFPIFISDFDATLPKETYLMSDTVHIGIANMQLYDAIQDDPGLAVKLNFTNEDVEHLQSSVTPHGYDWHHHEEPGSIQLVDEQSHGLTGHTGGRFFWGGGSEFR